MPTISNAVVSEKIRSTIKTELGMTEYAQTSGNTFSKVVIDDNGVERVVDVVIRVRNVVEGETATETIAAEVEEREMKAREKAEKAAERARAKAEKIAKDKAEREKRKASKA